jgi:hypothetical protein
MGVDVDKYEISRDQRYALFTWARYGQPVNPIIKIGVGKDGLVRDAPVPKREVNPNYDCGFQKET